MNRKWMGAVAIIVAGVGVGAYLPAQPGTKPQAATTMDTVFAPTRQAVQTPPPNIVTSAIAPTTEELRDAFRALSTGNKLSPLLRGKRYRVLKLHTHLEEGPTKPVTRPRYDTYRALIFNYTDNKAFDVYATIGSNEPISINNVTDIPDASSEEFVEAAEIAKSNPELLRLVASGRAEIYPAMPGILRGFPERTVAIGVSPLGGSNVKPAWLAVNLVRRQLAFVPAGSSKLSSADDLKKSAPTVQFAEAQSLSVDQLSVVAAATGCNPAARHDDALNSDVNGSQSLSVSWGNWTFDVWRPYSSQPQSGSHDTSAADGRGGGVELRYVYWKGKEVLYKAHVPILTAKYPNPGVSNCGPYRDWIFEESKFTGSIGGNGVVMNNVGTTILENGSDLGNFKGVAIWSQWDAAKSQNKLVVVSEIEAGWYRYVHKWTFYEFGQIVPEFGFEGTQNACTCNTHIHHPYWRFDFDIEGSGSDEMYEFASFSYKNTEFGSPRNFSSGSIAVAAVQDKVTLNYVNIYVGPNDGTVKTAALSQGGFAVNDWWGFAYNSAEQYDGVSLVQGTDAQIKPQINNWITGENVNGADIVLWYGAHFMHDVSQTIPSHYVGPTLAPSW